MSQQLPIFDGLVGDVKLSAEGDGPLNGLRFAAKDMFDVKGHVTGAGNLQWQRTHKPAAQNATAIDLLLRAGASLDGKGCTDELAYSMDGVNIHYGIPVNPQDKMRIPGGSSSGPASMVGTGMVDFALGTDTAGSIRVPASYCGVYSMRPTHGRISAQGVVPLARSFDTVCWLTRDAKLLSRVGSVLLAESTDRSLTLETIELVIMQELFELVEPTIKEQLMEHVHRISKGFGKVEYSDLTAARLFEWAERFNCLQAWEIWREHKDWILSCDPNFDDLITARFVRASTITNLQRDLALPVREEVLKALQITLKPNRILCLPPAWSLPPLVTAPESELNECRRLNYAFGSIASLAGAPQVTLPFSLKSGFTHGISFLGLPGSDALLLRIAEMVEERAMATPS